MHQGEAEPVPHEQGGVANRLGVGRTRLEHVGVGIRTGNHTERNTVTRDLSDHVAEDAERGDNEGALPRTGLGTGEMRAPRERGRCEPEKDTTPHAIFYSML